MDYLESNPGLLKRSQIQVLAGRYNNPIPIRFLATIDCSKIPAKRKVLETRKKESAAEDQAVRVRV